MTLPGYFPEILTSVSVLITGFVIYPDGELGVLHLIAMADNISFKDFGKSMYKKPSGDSNSNGQNTENKADLREKENKYLRVENEEGVNRRKSTNFGNISVRNLQRSLNDQLNEKKNDVDNDRQPPTDTGEYRLDLMQVQRKMSLVPFNLSIHSMDKQQVPENKGHDKTKISKEKADLNKSVIIKKPLLDGLSGVSVKDLSSSVIRSMLKKEADEERPKSDQGDADSYELQHDHCLSCFDRRCSKMKDCPVVKCKNKCGEASFHKCKQREHDELCKYKIIRCINETLGCRMEMPRYKLAYHLKHCTEMQQQPDTLQPPNFDKRVSRHPSDRYSTASFKNKLIHEHCLYCFSINCPHQKECVIKKCSNAGCPMRLHGCKIKEHKLICKFKEISCINKQHGCQYRFSRILLTEHLIRDCPVMNFEALSLPPYNLFQNKEQSHHCDTCFRKDCKVQVGSKCALEECYCGAKCHACKMTDHFENICPASLMPCINQQSGCEMFLTRCMLTTHLMHCPAMNWAYRKVPDPDYITPVSSNNVDKGSDGSDGSDEHIYEKLPKRKKKWNKKNCKVM